MSIYDFSVPKTDGSVLELSQYQGKVILVVNTATGCGFTPQYEQLEQLYEKYHAQGLEIVDIPCNQFAGQTPGTDEEIHQFCTLNYHTQFPQMAKSEVIGSQKLPLYGYLIEQKGFEGLGSGLRAKAMEVMLWKQDKHYKDTPEIKWNFTKFVIDRQGNVVARWEPTADMEKMEQQIASLL